MIEALRNLRKPVHWHMPFWQTPLQHSEPSPHERPAEWVPPPWAQHWLLFVLQLSLQQSELRLQWSPMFGAQEPESPLAPELLPLLLPLPLPLPPPLPPRPPLPPPLPPRPPLLPLPDIEEGGLEQLLVEDR
jgi:hypothetical protein